MADVVVEHMVPSDELRSTCLVSQGHGAHIRTPVGGRT